MDRMSSSPSPDIEELIFHGRGANTKFWASKQKLAEMGVHKEGHERPGFPINWSPPLARCISPKYVFIRAGPAC